MPLLFLMKLQHVRLPVRVMYPEELQHVSALAAAGLIEAEITPRNPTAPHASSCVATVLGITENGIAEIAKMGDLPELVKTSMRFTRGIRLTWPLRTLRLGGPTGASQFRERKLLGSGGVECPPPP